MSDGEQLEVSKAKTGKNLSLTTTSNNVGLVLADGAALILNYNPDARTLDVGDRVELINNYTTEVTDAIDFVMDVNGGKGPNKEGSRYDIRSFKTARFSKGCAGIEIDGIGCVVNLNQNYSESGTINFEGKDYSNYWQGAIDACNAQGMTLPDKDTLKSIYDTHTSGFPTSGGFWSSSDFNTLNALVISFGSGSESICSKGTQYRVLCVGN